MGKEFKDYTNDPNVINYMTPATAPSKYGIEKWTTREGLGQVQKWAEEGKGYAEIAKLMGISRNVLLDWRNKSYELQAAFDNGQEFCNAKVEDALFRKATGYMIEKTVIDNKGNEHIIQEYIQPDIKAIQYYLNNRCKDRWSGNITHQTNIQVPIIFGEDSIRK